MCSGKKNNFFRCRYITNWYFTKITQPKSFVTVKIVEILSKKWFKQDGTSYFSVRARTKSFANLGQLIQWQNVRTYNSTKVTLDEVTSWGTIEQTRLTRLSLCFVFEVIVESESTYGIQYSLCLVYFNAEFRVATDGSEFCSQVKKPIDGLLRVDDLSLDEKVRNEPMNWGIVYNPGCINCFISIQNHYDMPPDSERWKIYCPWHGAFWAKNTLRLQIFFQKFL